MNIYHVHDLKKMSTVGMKWGEERRKRTAISDG